MADYPGTSVAAPLQPCYFDAGSLADPLDLQWHGLLGKLTGGVSPIAAALAWQDWWFHLLASPGKQRQLAQLWWHQFSWRQAETPATISTPVRAGPDTPSAPDPRFAAPAWRAWPYNALARSFTGAEQFWDAATRGVRGVAPHHGKVVNFAARQLLDVMAPSNFAWTNPEVQRAGWSSGGASFLHGWQNWCEDVAAQWMAPGGARAPAPERPYIVGRDVARTPGKVVYRNGLVELIQYAPQTATVLREPVLIVPSWIMKYYILDLSPHNSLVRYLVGQGHTVFMISWRNPGAADRDLGMNDYLHHGVLDPLAVVGRIAGASVHAVGYCLGGTLLAMAAALLGAQRYRLPASLHSVTLLAAQTDFSDPGELGLFIDDSELAFLDGLMWSNGYLDGTDMARSFQLLNSRDLVWSRIMSEYLLGRRSKPNDLMAWNSDTTRLPYRMHSEYLRHLYLHNDLAEGRYCINGQVVALRDVRVPVFVVATERDHVSPWRSVYKIHLLASAPVEFVLAAGGHNAGIVSEPGHARRYYRCAPARAAGAAYLAPDDWFAHAQRKQGSWWPYWHDWLCSHGGPAPDTVAPPAMGGGVVLGDAPGQYVRAQ